VSDEESAFVPHVTLLREDAPRRYDLREVFNALHGRSLLAGCRTGC
jgi:2'-5' RNA ligase